MTDIHAHPENLCHMRPQNWDLQSHYKYSCRTIYNQDQNHIKRSRGKFALNQARNQAIMQGIRQPESLDLYATIA